MRAGKRVPCAAALLLLIGVTTAARAETAAESRTVVILAASGATTVANHLRAEAAEVGLVPIDDRSEMEEALALVCARRRAAGVIRVWSDVRIEIYLQARGDTPALSQVIEVGAGERDSLALRVVEEIRAHLVTRTAAAPADPTRSPGERPTQRLAAAAPDHPPPLRQQPPEQPEQGPPPTAAKESTPPAEALEARANQGATDRHGGLALSLAGGVAGAFSPGGFGPSLGATVAVAARAGSGLGVALRGAFPLATRDLSEREGSIRWRPWLVTIEACAEPWRRPRWALALGAEAGAALIDLDPRADDNHVANRQQMAIFVFLLGAGVRAQVAEGLALRAGVSLGIASPRPVVRVDGHEVATWGRPLVMVSLATELGLLAIGRRSSEP